MTRPEPDSPAAQARSEAAAEWLAMRDRGLTAAEQDEFLQWLAADPRHGEWFALHRRLVGDFNCLAQWRPEHSGEPNPDLLARPARRGRWLVPAVALAAAACVAFALAWWRPWIAPATRELASVGGYERRILEDGSTVELNRGAVVSVSFTAAERRIVLSRGEALFTVTKNPARPFIVHAGGVAVRAVGTAFNVRLDQAAVEVLVTHGRVALQQPSAASTVGRGSSSASTPSSTPTSSATAASVALAGSTATTTTAENSPELVAGQRATVSRTSITTAPQIVTVVTVTPEETARLLAWQPQLLDFSSVPLERAVAEFNRRNRVQFRLADETLAQMPIVATIRSDNVEGFERFLAETPGVQVERQGGEIVLRRKP